MSTIRIFRAVTTSRSPYRATYVPSSMVPEARGGKCGLRIDSGSIVVSNFKSLVDYHKPIEKNRSDGVAHIPSSALGII